MKKFVVLMLLIASTIFVSCDEFVSTEVKIVELSSDKTEVVATFTDFFDPVELVKDDSDILTIIMDRNTGVLYVQKETDLYKYGISPIYDSDGSILTKEKWLAKQSSKK